MSGVWFRGTNTHLGTPSWSTASLCHADVDYTGDEEKEYKITCCMGDQVDLIYQRADLHAVSIKQNEPHLMC